MILLTPMLEGKFEPSICAKIFFVVEGFAKTLTSCEWVCPPVFAIRQVEEDNGGMSKSLSSNDGQTFIGRCCTKDLTDVGRTAIFWGHLAIQKICV